MAGGRRCVDVLDVADRMSATLLTKNSSKSSTEWRDVDPLYRRPKQDAKFSSSVLLSRLHSATAEDQ